MTRNVIRTIRGMRLFEIVDKNTKRSLGVIRAPNMNMAAKLFLNKNPQIEEITVFPTKLTRQKGAQVRLLN